MRLYGSARRTWLGTWNEHQTTPSRTGLNWIGLAGLTPRTRRPVDVEVREDYSRYEVSRREAVQRGFGQTGDVACDLHVVSATVPALAQSPQQNAWTDVPLRASTQAEY
jgi:hypothetical protein